MKDEPGVRPLLHLSLRYFLCRLIVKRRKAGAVSNKMSPLHYWCHLVICASACGSSFPHWTFYFSISAWFKPSLSRSIPACSITWNGYVLHTPPPGLKFLNEVSGLYSQSRCDWEDSLWCDNEPWCGWMVAVKDSCQPGKGRKISISLTRWLKVNQHRWALSDRSETETKDTSPVGLRGLPAAILPSCTVSAGTILKMTPRHDQRWPPCLSLEVVLVNQAPLIVSRLCLS